MLSTLPLLDRYILKRLLDFMLLGLVLFTLVLFFSDALLDFMKDLQHYGITLDIALTLIGLQIPKIISIVIPMSALLATLLVYNALNNQFELIAMRMAGVSLRRLAMPAFTLAILACVATYVLQDYVVPVCKRDARALKTFAIDQQNLPATKENFLYKQFDDDEMLRRLLYVSSFDGHKLGYTTLVDLTNPGALQVTQAKAGQWGRSIIQLSQASVYTVAGSNKLSNTTQGASIKLDHFLAAQKPPKEYLPSELDFWALKRYIDYKRSIGHMIERKTLVTWWEKLSVPLSTLPLVLLAVPLSLTSPRRLTNIGFPLSILILFLYYFIRHVSVQLGESGTLPAFVAAFLPMFILIIATVFLFQKKSKTL